MSEITDLVQEYNQHEQEQRIILTKLFNAINERTGFRRVAFGDKHRPWSNCWDRERLDLALIDCVEPLIAEITEVQPGSETVSS